MGCDIHMYVEKKINNKWVAAQTFVKDSNGLFDVSDEDDIYTDRDYDLFCFLAGVRCDEESQHFEQKGFPDDASPEVEEICGDWGSDGHSHSWLTLKELQAVDWEDDKAMIKLSGIMNDQQWEAFDKSIKMGKPDYSLMYPYWQAGGDPKTSSYHEWEIPRKIAFKNFYEKVVERLPAYCVECKPNDIRIVFWFDN